MSLTLRWNGARLAGVALMILFAGTPVGAQTAGPFAGTNSLHSNLGFDALVSSLQTAVEANRMGIVAQASASRGAATRGVSIPGNAVVMVFRNDYAVRMLAASVPAGIEAPLRFYVTENPDRTATLTWRMPSSVFSPYGSAALQAIAKELDAIFDKIAREAVGG